MNLRETYQEFFSREEFTHHITVKPSSYNRLSIRQPLRTIEFKLNKAFLNARFAKNKAFNDQFSFFVFPQSKNAELHFHILLRSPSYRMRHINEACPLCFFKEREKQQNQFNTCPYCTTNKLKTLFKTHLPQLYRQHIHNSSPICITSIEEAEHSLGIYATREQKFSTNDENDFFIVKPEKNELRVKQKHRVYLNNKRIKENMKNTRLIAI